jgi:uncharacterized protein YjlB
MEPEIQTFSLSPHGDIPNNPLPLVLYRHALAPELRTAAGCQALFARNQWPGNWVDGIFDYWHFHLTGHEVLGCIAGWASVGFGGDRGVAVEFRAGDVAVVPAGVGHKRLSPKHDGFTVVGGYPPGQSGEIVRPGEVDADEARRRIAELALPRADPVLGPQGPLISAWKMLDAANRGAGGAAT